MRRRPVGGIAEAMVLSPNAIRSAGSKASRIKRLTPYAVNATESQNTVTGNAVHALYTGWDSEACFENRRSG
jgi:hypothetical protein